MDPITLTYFPYRLNFKYPFRIAHTERTGTDNVYVLLTHGNHQAWGECVFIPYYTETLDTFKTMINGTVLPDNTDAIGVYITDLKRRFPTSYFCIGALDIALHNLRTATTGQTIAQQYGLLENDKATSYTLGIASDEEMEQKFNDRPDMKYYKLKVNQEEVGRIVNTFQRLTSKPFTIDANQGFTNRKLALAWSYKLADLGVEYLEQPFHKEDFESHLWLKKQSPIPIIADESFQNYADLEKVVKYFDGINLKVMKCGGISEGVAALQRAKEMELKSIIGCMSESSVVSNAAKQISSLADWVDLDGPLLLTNDLFAEERSVEELLERLK
jgi:L-alanine-DL-glutamate epimerase-like enolase superfamily enzyme